MTMAVPALIVGFEPLYAACRSMGYLHDLGNPKVKEVTERAIKQIVSAGRTCGTSPLSLEEAQHHHDLGGKHTKWG